MDEFEIMKHSVRFVSRGNTLNLWVIQILELLTGLNLVTVIIGVDRSLSSLLCVRTVGTF